jgi:hypothetical protein
MKIYGNKEIGYVYNDDANLGFNKFWYILMQINAEVLVTLKQNK